MSEISLANALVGFASGAIGGLCNVCVGHPLDLVKVRQQMTFGSATKCAVGGSCGAMFSAVSAQNNTTVGMLQSIVRTDGVKGLYAGISAPLVAVIPAFALSFASYEFTKNRIRQHYDASHSSSVTIAQSASAGAISGIPLAFVVGPTERIKCLMQMYPKNHHYSSFGKAVAHVYKQGGIGSLTRGTFMTVCRDVPGNAAYFATYEYLKRRFVSQLNDNDTRPTTPKMMITATVLAGGFAGVANWIVAIPMDVVKSRWQAAEPGQYSNVRAVIRHLLQTQGPLAFFNGLTPALLRAFPANAACFLGAETAKRLSVLFTESTD